MLVLNGVLIHKEIICFLLFDNMPFQFIPATNVVTTHESFSHLTHKIADAPHFTIFNLEWKAGQLNIELTISTLQRPEIHICDIVLDLLFDRVGVSLHITVSSFLHCPTTTSYLNMVQREAEA